MNPTHKEGAIEIPSATECIVYGHFLYVKIQNIICIFSGELDPEYLCWAIEEQAKT